jgi:hypothetical protein
MPLTPYIRGLFGTCPLHMVAETLPTSVLPQFIEKIRSQDKIEQAIGVMQQGLVITQVSHELNGQISNYLLCSAAWQRSFPSNMNGLTYLLNKLG